MAHILIVEDNAASRLALRAVLEAAGHRVSEAKDGVEGLVQTRAIRPDLIISDLFMPRMDGYEFVRELRANPVFAYTPVVFTTATYDDPEARELAAACGVRRILPKPAAASVILETAAAALSEAVTSSRRSQPPDAEFDQIHLRLLTDKLAQKAMKLDAAERRLAEQSTTRRDRPILLVEDNVMDVDLTMEALREHGVANPIEVCRDGEDALRYIAAHAAPEDPQLPVMVLLDLRLPNVDGLDVLRAARADTVWKQVPIIILTTSKENDDIRRAYQIGINSYIVKPVDIDAFSDIVKQIKLFWLLINHPPFSIPDRPTS